jgi:hypothetical protein
MIIHSVWRYTITLVLASCVIGLVDTANPHPWRAGIVFGFTIWAIYISGTHDKDSL